MATMTPRLHSVNALLEQQETWDKNISNVGFRNGTSGKLHGYITKILNGESIIVYVEDYQASTYANYGSWKHLCGDPRFAVGAKVLLCLSLSRGTRKWGVSHVKLSTTTTASKQHAIRAAAPNNKLVRVGVIVQPCYQRKIQAALDSPDTILPAKLMDAIGGSDATLLLCEDGGKY